MLYSIAAHTIHRALIVSLLLVALCTHTQVAFADVHMGGKCTADSDCAYPFSCLEAHGSDKYSLQRAVKPATLCSGSSSATGCICMQPGTAAEFCSPFYQCDSSTSCSSNTDCSKGQFCFEYEKDIDFLTSLPCTADSSNPCTCATPDIFQYKSCSTSKDCETGARCGVVEDAYSKKCTACTLLPGLEGTVYDYAESVEPTSCKAQSNPSSTPTSTPIPSPTSSPIPSPTTTPTPSSSSSVDEPSPTPSSGMTGTNVTVTTTVDPSVSPTTTPSMSVLPPTTTPSSTESPAGSPLSTSSASPPVPPSTPSSTAAAAGGGGSGNGPGNGSGNGPGNGSGTGPGNGSGTGGTDSGVCVDVKLLRGFASHELVFAEHRRAAVLCDTAGNCATPGHMVVFRSTPMTMKRYCQQHVVQGCSRMIKYVNSPRMTAANRVRVASTSGSDLVFTALSARYGTRAEEWMLSKVIRYIA